MSHTPLRPARAGSDAEAGLARSAAGRTWEAAAKPERVATGRTWAAAGPEGVVAGRTWAAAGPERVAAGPEGVVAGPEGVVAGSGVAAGAGGASVAGAPLCRAVAGASVRKVRWVWVAAVSGLAVLGLGLFAVSADPDPGDAGRRAVAVGISVAPPDGDRAVENSAEGVAVDPAGVDGVAVDRARVDGVAVDRVGVDGLALDRVGADGAFIVTVTGVRCGVEAVGPVELRRRGHEQFCLVGVSVENAGREARRLDGGAQRAVDGHGRAYAVVGQAVAFLNERAPSLLDAIPGGATVRGVLPFEIPARGHLAALLVHESAGSRGARITLS